MPQARYDEVVDALGRHGRRARRSATRSTPRPRSGRSSRSASATRVEGYLEAGKAAGARAVVGGGRPADLPTGWYIEPTVFADVDNDMKIAREEIFGPVLSVIPYDGEEKAVAIANDSDYGLCGSVWTADAEHGAAGRGAGAHRYGRDQLVDDPRLQRPFGGFKQSGIGRELGPEGIAPYTEYQTIILPAG